MNKLKLTQFLLIGLLPLSSAAWGSEAEHFAKCTTFDSRSFGGYIFELSDPFGVDQHVSASEGPYGYVEKLPAKIGHHTWITYKATFHYLGKAVELEFSNFLSPSIGVGSIGEESVRIACQLTNGGV